MTKRAIPTTSTEIPYADHIDNGGSTKTLYDTLYAAFDHFNVALFGGRLAPAVLVLHRKRNAHGYFWKGVWHRDGDEAVFSEIALNPETMGRAPKDVLSTLVHEMVHHEQFTFGKPSKVGHNAEWCAWMERIDLTPIGVGNCAGKRFGRNFTHEIVEGGKFDVATTEFLAAHDGALGLCSKIARVSKKQDTSKVKHTCPDCGLNVWGKEGVFILCGDCNQQMRPAYYA